jgi:hypothetical protein
MYKGRVFVEASPPECADKDERMNGNTLAEDASEMRGGDITSRKGHSVFSGHSCSVCTR